MVEFALVFPLLFLVVSGIIDFGLAFSDLNSTRQGVREGARQAVVATFGEDTSCPVIGASPNATTHRAVCLTKARIGLGASNTRVKIVFTGLNQVGDSLRVCAQRPLSSTTGVFNPVLSNRALTAKVDMRIEKVDPLLLPIEESPLPGANWAWCS